MNIKLEIWGEYACFTRPETKAERMSYPVPTPSAARGILEAIYWKPEITWVVDAIHVLNPIRWANVRRNEVSSKASFRSAQTARKTGERAGIFIEDCRQQRHSLLLRDVRYMINAHFLVRPSHLPEKDASDNTPGKHLAIFMRRAERGQHFMQPYLGCREFPAHYKLVQGQVEDLLPKHQHYQDFGFMLHDLAFTQHPKTKEVMRVNTHVFHAVMRDGVIIVPPLP
jgi:CRISPR-associated protein Cas5d